VSCVSRSAITRLNFKTMDDDRLRHYMKELCVALRYAHARNLQHQDLALKQLITDTQKRCVDLCF